MTILSSICRIVFGTSRINLSYTKVPISKNEDIRRHSSCQNTNSVIQHYTYLCTVERFTDHPRTIMYYCVSVKKGTVADETNAETQGLMSQW